MKASEYIEELRSIIGRHGDLDMEEDGHGGRRAADPPRVAHRKILKGRERRAEFWTSYCDRPEQKGQKVIKI